MKYNIGIELKENPKQMYGTFDPKQIIGTHISEDKMESRLHTIRVENRISKNLLQTYQKINNRTRAKIIMNEKERKDLLKKNGLIEDKITIKARELTKNTLALGFLVSKRELERDGIIFGNRDQDGIVTEIRVRQWKE